jgi:hypothetical protein
MDVETQRKKLYFSHAYGYAAAITQRLHTAEGRTDLLQWIDASSPEFRTAVSKPGKRSVLHDLIHDLAFFDWEHEISHWRLENLDQFFADHDETIPACLRNDTDRNRDRLGDRLEKPLSKLVDGAFYVLFGDRNALFLFNQMIATKIQQLTPNEIPHMRRSGILPRPSYIPIWLRKAVFHRDKGRCQLCRRDLTALVNPVADEQFDHIWPLSRSGSNDATNFQLLCSRCNFRKYTDGGTSHEYYAYW